MSDPYSPRGKIYNLYNDQDTLEVIKLGFMTPAEIAQRRSTGNTKITINANQTMDEAIVDSLRGNDDIVGGFESLRYAVETKRAEAARKSTGNTPLITDLNSNPPLPNTNDLDDDNNEQSPPPNYPNYPDINIDFPDSPDMTKFYEMLDSMYQNAATTATDTAPTVETPYPEPIQIEAKFSPIEMIAMKSKSQRLWSMRKLWPHAFDQILDLYEHYYDSMYNKLSLIERTPKNAYSLQRPQRNRQVQRYQQSR